jgi:hypothetical protein
VEHLEELALELKDEQAVVLIEIVDGEYRIEHLTGAKLALATSEESRAA